MLIKAFDLLASIFQCVLFVWVCNNIVSKSNKISRSRSVTLFLLILGDVILFTNFSSINPPLANLLSLLITLLLFILFYRRNIQEAIVGFFLAYFVITISTYFVCTVYQYYFSKLNLNITAELSMVLFVYIPVFLLYPLFYIVRKYIFDVGMFLKNLKHSFIIVQLMTLALLFLNTVFMEWVTERMTPMVKAVIYIAGFLAFVFAAVYFAKINDKSKELEKLNDALNDKIVELKKIKHDFGSEISSLYGLYQLGKMDRLGELLKSIVERNQAFTPAVSINTNSNPLISSILNTAVSAGINVINHDSGDYEDLTITDNELLKLISNIIKNAIDVLANVENPIIKFNSYSNSNGITIMISNNGPEIPQQIKDKIFEAGFSTKDGSNGDRGYGLSIVKDIINKCNGKIMLRSNKEFTQFILEIPYKPTYGRKISLDV